MRGLFLDAHDNHGNRIRFSRLSPESGERIEVRGFENHIL
jgi:hypothetical protein